MNKPVDKKVDNSIKCNQQVDRFQHTMSRNGLLRLATHYFQESGKRCKLTYECIESVKNPVQMYANHTAT